MPRLQCELCHNPIPSDRGCDHTHFLHPDGSIHKRIRAGQNGDWVTSGRTCNGCGVKSGHYHHPGCEIERCPICGFQALGCRCTEDKGPIPIKNPKKASVARWTIPNTAVHTPIPQACDELRKLGLTVDQEEIEELVRTGKGKFHSYNLFALMHIFHDPTESNFVKIS